MTQVKVHAKITLKVGLFSEPIFTLVPSPKIVSNHLVTRFLGLEVGDASDLAHFLITGPK